MSAKYKILVVGCGELGSRHLQAVASLPVVATIVVVDPNPSAIELGQKRLQDLPNCYGQTVFQWHPSLEEVKGCFDLCIVATQAKGRCQLVKDIFNQELASQFLIEKIAVQSSSEYEDLLQFAKVKRFKIWVNCKTRAYPISKRIKSRLDASEPILFNVLGGNHGLANNGIHEVDLFTFFDGCKFIESRGVYIDPILHPSKRGPHVFDLSGTLFGVTAKGSQFTLSFAHDHAGPDHISIVTKSYRCIVDHMQRWAHESDRGGPWQQVSFEGNLMVSHMTKAFASDILNEGRCELPTLEECFPAHRFILGELQPHFEKLLKKNCGYCPVT